MNRRDVLSLGAVGGLAVSLNALAEKAAPPATAAKPVDPTALIAALEHCLSTGEACIEHCVRMLAAGDKSMAECLDSSRAMVAICTATAHFARVGSPHLKALAAVCAKACRDCEKTCAKHEMPPCKACGSSCKACAAECEKIAA